MQKLLAAKILAGISLLLLVCGFTVPIVGFQGTLERIGQNRIDAIPSWVYPLWNFYQHNRYIGFGVPSEAEGDLAKMIEAGAQVGVPSLPVWRFSLEAPNYPKEAFPEGLPIFIHLDGLSGEVQEMNTINHYVGMAPMEHGAPIEKALAPYALMAVSFMLFLFVLYDRLWTLWLLLPGVLLPFIFLGIYGFWLYYFGHNLSMGAITIEPFMPVLMGKGKVAQFTTHAGPAAGFWVLLAISFLSIAAGWLKSRALANQKPGPIPRRSHIAAIVALLASVIVLAYVAKTQIQAQTWPMAFETLLKKPQPIPAQVPMAAPPESIERQQGAPKGDEEQKIGSLREKAGRIGALEVSAEYRKHCSSCHGLGGEGGIGPVLAGRGKEELQEKIKLFLKNEDPMHIAILEGMSQDQIDALAGEIAGFGSKE